MTSLPFISADQAVRAVRSGDHIHLSSIASVPHILIDALCRRAGELADVHFHHFHTEGPAPYGSAEFRDSFFDQGFFVGPNLRPPTGRSGTRRRPSSCRWSGRCSAKTGSSPTRPGSTSGSREPTWKDNHNEAKAEIPSIPHPAADDRHRGVRDRTAEHAVFPRLHSPAFAAGAGGERHGL